MWGKGPLVSADLPLLEVVAGKSPALNNVSSLFFFFNLHHDDKHTEDIKR